MASVCDNWERLVRATVKREQLKSSGQGAVLLSLGRTTTSSGQGSVPSSLGKTTTTTTSVYAICKLPMRFKMRTPTHQEFKDNVKNQRVNVVLTFVNAQSRLGKPIKRIDDKAMHEIMEKLILLPAAEQRADRCRSLSKSFFQYMNHWMRKLPETITGKLRIQHSGIMMTLMNTFGR